MYLVTCTFSYHIPTTFAVLMYVMSKKCVFFKSPWPSSQLLLIFFTGIALSLCTSSPCCSHCVHFCVPTRFLLVKARSKRESRNGQKMRTNVKPVASNNKQSFRIATQFKQTLQKTGKRKYINNPSWRFSTNSSCLYIQNKMEF